MIPSLGRTVLYTLTQEDVEHIIKRRGYLVEMVTRQHRPRGVHWHGGNLPQAGEQLPAIVVNTSNEPVEGSAANLQVFLDGNDQLWVTSRRQGTTPGTWQDPRDPKPTPAPASPANTPQVPTPTETPAIEAAPPPANS